MRSDSMWANSMDRGPPTLPQPLSTMLPMPQQPPVIRPVYTAPVQELQLFPASRTTPTPPQPSSNVSRPHARYPTLSDSWPGQLLSSLPRTAQEDHLCSSSSISTTSSREEGLDKSWKILRNVPVNWYYYSELMFRWRVSKRHQHKNDGAINSPRAIRKRKDSVYDSTVAFCCSLLNSGFC